MENTTISLRAPVDLIGLIDEEAKQRDRSRAYIIIEKLKANYNPKPAAKRSRKKEQAQ